MMKGVVLFCGLCIIQGGLFAQEPDTSSLAAPSLSSTDQQRLMVIRYGTDTEIANLIKTLRSEQAQDAKTDLPLDPELLTLAEKSKNRTIISGILNYYGDREKGGLEKRALQIIEDRDYEGAETVNAAIDYLGKVQASGIHETLISILDGEETRYLPGAIRTLGKTAAKSDAGKTAEYLIEYYANRESGDENRRLIISAVGDTGAKEGTAFLVSIVENEEERAPLRIAALAGLSKSADPDGLKALIGAVSSRDPNVRSSAVEALGPFTGEEAEEAVMDSFRDSYYRTRIAAAKAAGERQLARAVPFLRFRAENDDVPAVRDEAIKSIALIGGEEADGILKNLFSERKNNDRIRINAGEMLLSRGSRDYTADVIVELEDAKTRNQTALYNGFLRILGSAKSDKLEDLARRFFAAGGVVEKSYAIDICANNDFRSLAGELQRLADPKNGSLSRKSLTVLEKWGLSAAEPDPGAEDSAAEASGSAAENPKPENPEYPAPREPISNEAAD
ncbi:MAG: HEAT repeat domain-containing protein [Spirochaetaceae bacterium]|jgi:HEAT repeat protein|nr:HEAT repeat domain-containing protein [Spirochaetaceae bacterium]